MDPKQTYLDMVGAMQAKDYEGARELAEALKEWFDSGGFCPIEYTRQTLYAYTCNVLRRTAFLGAIY